MLDPKIEDAISAFIKRLDERAEATSKTEWSEADDRLLRKNYGLRTTAYLARRLRCCRSTVENRAAVLNLGKRHAA